MKNMGFNQTQVIYLFIFFLLLLPKKKKQNKTKGLIILGHKTNKPIRLWKVEKSINLLFQCIKR